MLRAYSAARVPGREAGSSGEPPGETMKTFLTTAARVAVVAALLLSAVTAEAQTSRRRRWVPEFDPATVGAIATLLVGGGILIKNRRRR